MKLTKKRRAMLGAYFAILVGAVVALKVDKATGVALMMASVYTIGLLQKEVFPHEETFSDGHKTPKPGRKE